MLRFSSLLAFVLLVGCSDTSFTEVPDARWGETRHAGPPVALGNGTATAFATVLPTGQPTVLGVEMTADAMEGLPATFSDGRACYDRDQNGEIDNARECAAGHEYVLDLPDQPDVPFQYVLLTVNPMGHSPPGVYDLPHVDVRFYLQDLAEVREIDAGPCPGITACDDHAEARIPVSDGHVPEIYVDRGMVEPMAGNHLVDPTSPEFNGKLFTRAFVYGVYGGRVTFYDPMVTRARLLSQIRHCDPIPQPGAWAESGWYPTAYCTDYKQRRHRITLEEFVYREARDPA